MVWFAYPAVVPDRLNSNSEIVSQMITVMSGLKGLT